MQPRSPITAELRAEILERIDPEFREAFQWHLKYMEFVDGQLVVYRDMRVTPEWIGEAQSGLPIGTYWNWGTGELSPYGGDPNAVRFIMTALVDPLAVDWNHTAQVWRHAVAVIALKDGTPLTVIGTKAETRRVPDWDTWSPRISPIPDDLDNWVGHTFVAGYNWPEPTRECRTSAPSP